MLAFVETVLPPKVTVTASPGEAVPYTGTGRSRCSTMWSVKTPDSWTSACAVNAASRTIAKYALTRFIIILFIRLLLGICFSRGGVIDHALHRGEPGGGFPFEKGVAGEQNEGDCRLSQSPRRVAPQAFSA